MSPTFINLFIHLFICEQSLFQLFTFTAKGPFTCDLCQKQFVEISKLKIHLNLHTREARHLCTYCGKGFQEKTHLAHHVAHYHTGEFRFYCSDCGKGFNITSNFRIHKRKHTGEKPFVCSVCGFSVVSKGALKRHNLVHSGVRKYKCHICDRAFKTNMALKTHMRGVHKFGTWDGNRILPKQM